MKFLCQKIEVTYFFTLETLSHKKTVVILRYFNADLLKCDKDSNISDFLDVMYPNLLLPHVASSTHVTEKSVNQF